jgi:hypothetical protein
MDGQKDVQTERHDETSSSFPRLTRIKSEIYAGINYILICQLNPLNHTNKVYIAAFALKGICFTSVSHLVGRGDYFRTSTTLHYVD